VVCVVFQKWEVPDDSLTTQTLKGFIDRMSQVPIVFIFFKYYFEQFFSFYFTKHKNQLE